MTAHRSITRHVDLDDVPLLSTPLRSPVITFASQLAGIDVAAGQMLFISSAAGQQLYTTNNLGVSFSADRTLPAGVWNEKKKIVAFGGKLYLLCVTASVAAIWRTTPTYTLGQTWTWTQVFSASAGTPDNLPTCLSTDGTYLYFGEYADPVGGPQLYRSSDGTTWTSVLGPLTGNRHCHAIEPDPYNPGHVWATFGDGGNKYVMRSTDYGANWTTVVSGVTFGTWAQVAQISFDKDRVWLASDDVGSSGYCMDRTELIPRMFAFNRHTDLPVPAAIPRRAGSAYDDGVFTNGSTTLTSATAAFSSAAPQSDVGRSIYSSKLPGGVVSIASVTNATTVVLSAPATSGGTATFHLGGSRWPETAYFAAVDPATGIYYMAGWDQTIMEEPLRGAIFYVPYFGSRVELLQTLPPTGGLTRWQTFIYQGYVWSARWRVPLLAK